jgi:ribonuclease Y
MTAETVTILTAIVALIAGMLVGLFLIKPKIKLSLEEYEKQAAAHVGKTGEEAKKIKAEIIGRIENVREKSRTDEERMKEQFKRIENLIVSKEDHLSRKKQRLDENKKILDEESAFVEELRKKNSQSQNLFIQKLALKTGQGIDHVKSEIMLGMERDLEMEREIRIRKYEEYLNDEKERIAKNMITGAIQRYSSPTSVEKKADIVTVPRDEIKGRVVGRNAENIKLLEELTGVDIIFNDAPNTIIIACHDLIKKHVAKETVAKLIRERIITPDKVRAAVAASQGEMEKTLIRIGREIIKKLEMEGRNFPDEFARIIGRLQFRTSYGQNIVKHSMEVGNFTVMLGSELGLNLETCKAAGFFHDIGKAIDQEVGGSHDALTKEIMEKYGFSEEEIHAAWTHHDAAPQRTPEAMLVKAGDAISAGRPGARAESIEKYLERIRALETISSSYEGVSKAYAISAGREVRVITEPSKLKDSDLHDLAGNIAREIEENLTYPGKIKINVIRRTQSVDYANRVPGPSKGTKKTNQA